MSLGEIKDLLSWIGDPPRSPRQTHGLNESDCEVLDLGNGTFLAATIDTVSEEISAGLYRDPYRIGWMAAMASLSDLAAVGARPLGMLLSAEWATSVDPAGKAEVARGFSEALRSVGTFWLGGDTGRAGATTLAGVGLGICEGRPLSRLGMRPGDYLCVTGQTGLGPALAIRFLRGESAEQFAEANYLPTARVETGIKLRQFANAAMDTSDGMVQTLETLRTLNSTENGAGLELHWVPELIAEPARKYCAERGIPEWVLWEVEHGDYQLMLSISEEKLAESKACVPDLHVIGRVSETPGIRLHVPEAGGGERVEAIDAGFAHSLLKGAANDVSRALGQMIEHCRQRGLP